MGTTELEFEELTIDLPDDVTINHDLTVGNDATITNDLTVGNDATITNMPKEGRFFEFDFQPGKKVSISLDENGIAVMFSTKLFDSNDASLKSNWFSFLKELRLFAKKRMLNFPII